MSTFVTHKLILISVKKDVMNLQSCLYFDLQVCAAKLDPDKVISMVMDRSVGCFFSCCFVVMCFVAVQAYFQSAF